MHAAFGNWRSVCFASSPHRAGQCTCLLIYKVVIYIYIYTIVLYNNIVIYFTSAPWHCSVFLCMLSDPEILGDSLIQFCYGVVWVRRLSYPIPLRRCMGNVEFSGVSELYLARLVLGSVLIIFGVLSGGFRILTCVYFC